MTTIFSFAEILELKLQVLNVHTYQIDVDR